MPVSRVMEGEVDEAGVERGRASSKKFDLILFDTCKGEPYRMVVSDGHGQGLENSFRRCASKTPGTKRALLRAAESFEQLLKKWSVGMLA